MSFIRLICGLCLLVTINLNAAEVSGRIAAIDGNQITVQPKKGEAVTVEKNDTTVIEPAGTAFKNKMKVSIIYDETTNIASSITPKEKKGKKAKAEEAEAADAAVAEDTTAVEESADPVDATTEATAE